MARVANQKPNYGRTFEGGPVAVPLTPIQELRRAVLSCLLWENEFYRSGHETAQRIKDLAKSLPFDQVAELAQQARGPYKLRHVPLWLLVSLLEAGHKGAEMANLIAEVIQRPDEMSELLALWFQTGKKETNAMRKGLAKAFKKFNEYSLAKFDKPGTVSIRDVMFISHPKPETEEQAELFRRVANKQLATPDTWETQLSAGKDKKETWTRLILERKLGPQATLKNLRNMVQAGVEPAIIRQALSQTKTDRILPFEFITAARYAPQYEPELEALMFKCLEGFEKLKGTTTLLIDVSGSMDGGLSGKSELKRLDAACGLAILTREVCEHVNIFTFSDDVQAVKPRRGFALRDAIGRTRGGTATGAAVDYCNKNAPADRLIVFTDEQSHDRVGGPKNKGYMVNIATYEKSVGFGPWHRVNGFSEAIVQYIQELERANIT